MNEIKPLRHGDTEKQIYYDEKLTDKIIACAIEVLKNGIKRLVS